MRTIVDHGAVVAAIASGQSPELTDEQNQAVAVAVAFAVAVAVAEGTVVGKMYALSADLEVVAKLAYVAEHGADVQAGITDGPVR